MKTCWGDFAGIADPLKFCIIPALSPREAMKFGRCSKALYRCVQIRFQCDLEELIEKITPLMQKTNAQGAGMIAAEFKRRIFQISSRYDQKLPPNLTSLRTTLSESADSSSVTQTIVSILRVLEVAKFLGRLEPEWRGYLNSWKNGKKGILALGKALDLSKTVPSFVMKELSKKSSLEVSELQLKQCPIIHEGIRHLKNLQKLIVTHGSFNEIGALLEMPQLRELCLESSSPFSLYPLEKLTSLESLTLSECDLRDSGEQLSQSIRSLTLIGCWGKGPLKDVEIKNSGQLENVCLDRLSIAESSEGLFTISLSSLPNVRKMGGGGAKRGSLESLSLLIEGLNSLDEVDFGNIRCIGEIAIRQSPNLKSCRLPTHCQLAALVDLPSLVSAHLENKEHSFGSLYLFDLPKLHLPFLSVSVSNIYLGGDLQINALQILAKNADGYGEVMAASPMLEALSVKSSKKKTMALDLFSNSQLERLALTDCIGGLESPFRFPSGQLEAFAKIQALNISGAAFDGFPVEICNLRSLTELTLRRISTVSGEWGLELPANGEFSKLTALKLLNLSNNFFLTSTTEVFQLPNLEKLYLKNTSGVVLPSELSPSLSHLDLREAGLYEIPEILRSPTLKSVRLDGNPIQRKLLKKFALFKSRDQESNSKKEDKETFRASLPPSRIN